MGFKENLLKKIEIDNYARKILSTTGPTDSGMKMDMNATRRLLEMSPYQYQKERDIDVYILKTEGEKDKILVLDNDLPIYQTTVEDVGLRKSPTIKEMLSFRNARKILSDSDVKLSRKDASVKILRTDCISLLDLSFDVKDIERIGEEGTSSLERDYADGIEEALILLSELLGYRPVPRVFQLRHNEIYARIEKKPSGQYQLGPVVIYNKMDNSLKMMEEGISGPNAQIIKALTAVSSGEAKADIEGADVFHKLVDSVDMKHLSADDPF